MMTQKSLFLGKTIQILKTFLLLYGSKCVPNFDHFLLNLTQIVNGPAEPDQMSKVIFDDKI